MARPRIIKSPEEMDRKVDEYVELCREREEPVTLTGLVLHLGFSHRRSLDEYKNYDGFSHSVTRAKTIVENAYERNLHKRGAGGSKFALKNMGWSDKQEHELMGEGGGPIEVTPVLGEDAGGT